MRDALLSKAAVRLLLKEKRAALSAERRKAVAHALSLHPFPQDIPILSFTSFGSEIDTLYLNAKLLQQNRLYLPKIQGDTLEFYNNNTPFSYAVPYLLLVPGLGFDKQHHRIGYGKGFYDRFLSTHPHCLSLGIGFQEQLVDHLPLDPHDQPLTSLLLL